MLDTLSETILCGGEEGRGGEGRRGERTNISVEGDLQHLPSPPASPLQV